MDSVSDPRVAEKGGGDRRGEGDLRPPTIGSAQWSLGLLHAWESMDCSLYTNALVDSPPSVPHASPWPGLVGRISASMTLVLVADDF